MANLIEASAIAPAQMTGKSWRIKVIEGDRQGSSAFYPKEALQEGASLFAKGTRIFMNHPSADDKFNQPERRVQDIVGYLSEGATYDGKDLYANATFLSKYQDEIKELAEAGVIGMSIRAEGEVTESAGKKTLSKFTRVNSVDVVTSPGAGGGFDTLLESERNSSASESVAESEKKEESAMDPKLAEALDALVEASKTNTDNIAKLTEGLTALAEAKANPFAKKTDAAKAEDAKDGGKDDDEEDANGKVIPKKKVKESATFAQIDTALTEAKLTPVSRASVLEAVEAGADLTEAIAAETAKVRSILEEASASFAGFASDGGSEKPLEESTKDMIAHIYG